MATPFLPQEIICQKRDGLALEKAAVQDFIQGVTNGSVSDGQIGAFAMACFINGMTREETISLTLAMRDSGLVLNWPELDRPILDKHSTGGVGDNVSLMLAPILAACGAAVPMISGRGLGHTGGTLDKLDSIPGYQSEPSESIFRQTVRDVGCAIIGQTSDLAPADKRIYAVRDVTATVESMPLITASILSKKLAAGLQGLVLDVKFGSGAVMADQDEARKLAQSLVDVANGASLPTSAFLTNMDEPLANCSGNALEVQSAVEFLTGAHQPDRLSEVILALAGELLFTGGLADSANQGAKKAQHMLDEGHAAEIFERMIHTLGGPSDLLKNAFQYLPQAPVTQPVLAERDGYISHWKTRDIGMAVVTLGGGRKGPHDMLDYSVGISNILPLGTKIAKGDAIALVHARSKDHAMRSVQTLSKSVGLSAEKAQKSPIIESHIVG